MRTTGMFDNMSQPDVWKQHQQYWYRCAQELLFEQGKNYIIDENNYDIIKFLLLYFNQSKRATDPSEYKSEQFKQIVTRYDLSKNIMLVGQVGTGKTLLMQIFSLYLQRTKNILQFRNTSVTEMLNYYKVNNHLDYYTYNIGKDCTNEKPEAFCLNDVGIDTTKHYGVELKDILDEYFHARNECYTQYGKRNHITSNLDKKQILQFFRDPYSRLADRFKTYNIIPLTGESRR